MKKALTAAFIVVIAVCITACSTPLTGKWDCSAIKYLYPGAEEEKEYYFEFDGDGMCTAYYDGENMGEMKYECRGENFKLYNPEGEAIMKGKVEGDKIITDGVIIFQKRK